MRGVQAQDILVVDTLSAVRTLCKGLPQVPHAQRAHCLSSLPPIAGESWLPWSYTLRCVAQWSVMRTDLPPHQDYAIVQEFYDKGRSICNKDACAVLAWAACETAPPCQLLLRQPDKWVTDAKGNSVLRRPFLPAFFCQHPLMATLDMHGELCTWRLFTLRRHSGSSDAPPRTAYGALLRDHNRQLVATLTSMNSAPSGAGRVGSAHV